MKKILLLSLLGAAVLLCGCASETVLPDQSTTSKPLPPGTKTKDVLLQIKK